MKQFRWSFWFEDGSKPYVGAPAPDKRIQMYMQNQVKSGYLFYDGNTHIFYWNANLKIVQYIATKQQRERVLHKLARNLA